MGKKYWLALANLIWLGCWPAAMVQASEGQVVVSNAAMQHDWYQNSTAEQARRELELQLQEAVLAQLHPDFYTLWKKLQAKPADQRGALYDEAFGKLARFQQAWRAMDLVSREQMQTLKLNLSKPLAHEPVATICWSRSGSSDPRSRNMTRCAKKCASCWRCPWPRSGRP